MSNDTLLGLSVAPIMKLSNLLEIQFDHLSNDSVKALSVKEISYPDTYEGGFAKKNGLLDNSMGTTTNHTSCLYCGGTYLQCEGHIGRITLGKPQFHTGFLPHVINIFKCVCLDTCKLLLQSVPKTVVKKRRRHRIRDVRNMCLSLKKSPYTNFPVPKVTLESNQNKRNGCSINVICDYVFEKKDMKEDPECVSKFVDAKKRIICSDNISVIKDSSDGDVALIRVHMCPEECFKVLQCISKDDLDVMGYSENAKDFIIRTYPVPPLAIRPSLRNDVFSDGYGENNLTQKLCDIVKWNNRYVEEISKPDVSKNAPDYNNLVQYHIMTYYDNDSKIIPRSDLKTCAQPSRSLTSRFKGGKTGRIRANLMAKRVNFSARTVITSDPFVKTDELGMPLMIAMKLTYPEIVTKQNMSELAALVNRGKDSYPGANFVEDVSNPSKPILYDTRYIKKNPRVLAIGNIVHRHLRDGDVVLFNRQPSLHKMNMMCHKLKVIKNASVLTFRMNVTVTEPYGADFDGDEMNIFVPQSASSSVELELLASVSDNAVSPKHSVPVIALKQDTLIGLYLLSSSKNTFCASQLSFIMGSTTLQKLPPYQKQYRGLDILSCFLPPDMNFRMEDLVIEKGVIKPGSIITKTHVGARRNNLIHWMLCAYGPKFMISFLDNMQILSNNYLMMYHGFTIGLHDFTVNNDIATELTAQKQQRLEKIHSLIKSIEDDDNKIVPREVFEKVVYQDLDSLKTDQAKFAQDNLDDTNKMYLMSIKMKSKGDLKNIGFTMCCLGQTAFRGSLISFTNERTLPYFAKCDDTPPSRGFISSNYTNGLTCSEFFYHNLDGRQGIIDTAIKTADTGYMQRKMIKAAEDIFVDYTKYVRNSSGDVFQFIYGDGFKLVDTVSVRSKILTMDDPHIDKVFPEPVIATYLRIIRDRVRNGTLKTPAIVRRFNVELTVPSVVVDLTKIDELMSRKKNSLKRARLYNPLEIHSLIQRDILSPKSIGLAYLGPDDEVKQRDMSLALDKLALILYERFNPITVSQKMTAVEVDAAVHRLRKNLMQHVIQAGDMCGVVSAQRYVKKIYIFFN